jgi:L-methionine (R)-S-oxide reductase
VLESIQKSLLNVCNSLKSQNDDYYWVGFYILIDDHLHLGPYLGPHTDHTLIPIGRGVCGYAVKTGQSQNIADVSAFGDYLACNLFTKSEYVGLIRYKNQIIGQIDIDCTTHNGFDAKRVGEIEDICKQVSWDLERYRQGRIKADHEKVAPQVCENNPANP